MFRQGQTEGVDGPLHFIEINVGQRQRLMQEDAFPCLIEHKRPMHEGAIHLEEASKELARKPRHVQNPLFEDENGVITVQDKVFEPSLFILHNDHTLSGMLIDNREL